MMIIFYSVTKFEPKTRSMDYLNRSKSLNMDKFHSESLSITGSLDIIGHHFHMAGYRLSSKAGSIKISAVILKLIIYFLYYACIMLSFDVRKTTIPAIYPCSKNYCWFEKYNDVFEREGTDLTKAETGSGTALSPRLLTMHIYNEG